MKRSPLKRRKPLKRGGGIRKMSEKRRRDIREYHDKRMAFLAENPLCKRCSGKARDIHHTKLRHGKNYLDVSTWAALCRRCHTWVHDNPAKAEEIGLLHPDRFK